VTLQGRIRPDVRRKSDDLYGRSLDCAAPASCNANVITKSHRVVSCGPLNQLTAGGMHAHRRGSHDIVVEKARAARHELVWHEIRSAEQLGEVRIAIMRRFPANFTKDSERDASAPRRFHASISGMERSTLHLLPLLLYLLGAGVPRLPRHLRRGDVSGRVRGADVFCSRATGDRRRAWSLPSSS
jgi:hypothetical protein